MSIQQPYRLFHGGRIDRERPLTFTFNGVRQQGFAGDTLASALLADGVHLLGRSFKYHRPRGIVSDGAEEPNALVQLESAAHTQPNVRATQVELYEGLHARSQNCWPNVGFDLGAINNVLSPVLPAGFYYKTFMWPAASWQTYERYIRRAAGLGKAPREPDPDRYDKMHAHCDVLVVGAGPAGIAAGLAAARCGARVMVADEQAELGGSLLATRATINDQPAMEWVAEKLAELADYEDVAVLKRSTVSGYFDHNYLTIVERLGDHRAPAGATLGARQRLWKVRAKQVVLATGAHERPFVFANNDRPGIMLASAAMAYANRYAVRCGNRAVVFTNNDSAYEAALDLSDAGIELALVDWRRQAPEDQRAALRKRGVEVLTGHAVVRAKGRARVRAVEVAERRASGDGYTGRVRQLNCDLVCMSSGWNPAVHLFSQSRGKLRFDAELACFVPAKSAQQERSAGAARGLYALKDALADGFDAGRAAANGAGHRKRAGSLNAKTGGRDAVPPRAVWVVPPLARTHLGKHFVDFQNDVTAADVNLAAREGYVSVEHLKRYTTTGMGTDQGKTSNVNAIGLLGLATGADLPDVGTTTFRPPYTPVTFGTLAGRDVGELSDPVRVTPMHHWHVSHEAEIEDVGQWKRAWFYPRPGEAMRDAVDRECLAARQRIGILDASTLGKIDIKGPDAVALLERVYTNDWRKLAIGRCRYGLMCTEDGMVFDDGVTMRLAEQRYLMTTTTGNAARVLAWLEEWLQTEWPELDVYCTSVTEQWATITIVGPYARALLAELSPRLAVDAESFPFMSWRAAQVAGVEARIARVSFTGELSYEITVPAHCGLYVWTVCMQAGAKYGITPYGTEAMHVLRAEKGFIIAGQDTDGTVTPIDLGMQGLVSQGKDFLGKRSLARSDTQRPDRKQLVGLLVDDALEVLPEGAQVVAELEPRPPMKMIGHVTSSYYSANLGHPIALALIAGGHQRDGEVVHVPLDRGPVSAKITSPVFFDREGARGRG